MWSKGHDKPQILTIYSASMQGHMIKAIDEFEKKGITVDSVRMSSGDILERISAEKENPTASVWFGEPADGFI